MKIAVLMGGLSKEREISLRSGMAVSVALKKKGHEVIDVTVNGSEFIDVLRGEKPDVVFIALHGRFGEDGSVQGVLEWLKIPYTSPSILASALCLNKLAAKEVLVARKLPTPDYRVLRRGESLEGWIKKFDLPYPCIAKPNLEGSSIGVVRIFKKDELKKSLEEALKYDETVIVEKMIQGREITVGVHNGKALPIVEVIPLSGFYDLESKYTKGKTRYEVPAKLNEKRTREIQKLSEEIYGSLQCQGAVRIDFMLDGKENPYCLEVNTIPGMTETSLLPKAAACVGLSFEDLCEEIVKGARVKSG